MIPGPPFTPPGTSESSGTYVYVHVIGPSATVLPSADFAVALRWTTSPVWMTSSLIAIWIELTGFATTLYVFIARASSTRAVMVTLPGLMAVTVPQRSTVATDSFELDQCGAMSLRSKLSLVSALSACPSVTPA